MAEINAAIQEEREARHGLGLKEAFFGKGNLIRFVIAFAIFLFQQWCGQNSVNYYGPQIFAAIGYTGTVPKLLATGIYGVVKLVATIFISFCVETLGRKLSLQISALGMSILFLIIGDVLETHPPPVVDPNHPTPAPPASRATAGLLYIYVCFYSTGRGLLLWVYVSPTSSPRVQGTTASLSHLLLSGYGVCLRRIQDHTQQSRLGALHHVRCHQSRRHVCLLLSHP